MALPRSSRETQKSLVGHDTALRPSVASTTCGCDQDAPLYESALPRSSTAMQKRALGQDTAVNPSRFPCCALPVSMGSGGDHDFPSNVWTLPDEPTTTQNVGLAQEI